MLPTAFLATKCRSTPTTVFNWRAPVQFCPFDMLGAHMIRVSVPIRVADDMGHGFTALAPVASSHGVAASNSRLFPTGAILALLPTTYRGEDSQPSGDRARRAWRGSI